MKEMRGIRGIDQPNLRSQPLRNGYDIVHMAPGIAVTQLAASRRQAVTLVLMADSLLGEVAAGRG